MVCGLYGNGYLRSMLLNVAYSKTCLKWSLKKKTKMGFKIPLSLNAGQKYCRMRQGSIIQYSRPSLSYHCHLGEYSAIRSTVIKLPFVTKGRNMQYFRPSLSYHLSLRGEFCNAYDLY